MLRVRIDINFTNILDLHAVRIKGDSRPHTVNTYQMPDGRKIKHRYGDGAAKLAIKMLRLKDNKTHAK